MSVTSECPHWWWSTYLFVQCTEAISIFDLVVAMDWFAKWKLHNLAFNCRIRYFLKVHLSRSWQVAYHGACFFVSFYYQDRNRSGTMSLKAYPLTWPLSWHEPCLHLNGSTLSSSTTPTSIFWFGQPLLGMTSSV